MATVTTYAGCPCCDTHSGSGSGNYVYPVLLCNGRTLPSVLYATFTGFVASLGTVELVYRGGVTWAATVAGSQCFAGADWLMGLSLCVAGKHVPFPLDDGVFTAETLGGTNRGCYFPLPRDIKPVDNFSPFLFTESDILEAQNTPTEVCPPPCGGQTAGVVITETPP